MQTLLHRLGLILILTGFVQSLAADEEDWTNPLLTERFYIGGGGIFNIVDTEAQLDTDTTPGTNIDYEDVFNIDKDVTNFFGKASWRISPKHKLDIEYFEVSRSGSTSLSRQITFDGDIINAGATTNSKFETQLFRLGYAYSFFNDGQKEAGLNAGLHVAKFNFDFTARGTINSIAGSVDVNKQDLTLPLPNFGLHGVYAFNENIALNARTNAFYLSISDYTGYIIDIAADVVYSFNDSFGLAAGMSSLYYSFEADGGDFQGDMDHWLWGPRAYAYFSF